VGNGTKERCGARTRVLWSSFAVSETESYVALFRPERRVFTRIPM
jgi:hypothetical protein